MIGTGRIESYDLPGFMDDSFGNYKEGALNDIVWQDGDNNNAISTPYTVDYTLWDDITSHTLRLDYDQWNPSD